MDNNRRINAIIGSIVFFISLLIYMRTIAPTTSFWDCGEFIACSFTLGVPHPPGAPLYILIGRVFTMIPFAEDIGLRVNIISALATAFSVLFTYLIIVRLVQLWRGVAKSLNDRIIVFASGVIGALAFAFTDSLWFNAVEAEVYSISIFFTAIVVWLILVWSEKADDPSSDRYLLMIAYCIGLAIAVHLLMILALPFVFLIFYFRKYHTASFLEFFIHGVIAVVVLGIAALIGMFFKAVAVGILLFLIGHYIYARSKISESAQRYVRVAYLLGGSLLIFSTIYPGVIKGIPYIADKLSLTALGIAVLVLFIAVAVAISQKERWVSLGLLSLLMIVIGYSTYTAIYIRSGLDPTIDENDPETTERMVSYLNREQYGTWGVMPRRFPNIPIEYEFKREFPNQNYKLYEFGKQVNFLWNYQLNKMYWRYFGWQFIGKGTTIGQDGYIIELLSLNGLFALPFLIGLFGMVHHFVRDWKRALPILVLFIMTGVAIVIYLNQENPQPRERDYVYVGSFFAFALWIGTGVAAILEWIGEALKNSNDQQRRYAIFGATLALCVVPGILFMNNYESHNRSGNYVAYDYSYNLLQTCEKDALVFTNGDNDTFPLWFLQEVYGVRKDVRVVNLSLLNTPWYIKQLRDQEPRVPIRMSDAEIDALRPRYWKTSKVSVPVPGEIKRQDLQDMGQRFDFMDADKVDKITFEVEPTLMGQGIRVQDEMILRILVDNEWQRPVYFAVTVSHENKLNMYQYLRMDGLDFKVVTVPGNYQISPERLHNVLFNVFRYRNLDNPDVYYNDNIIGLLQNYRVAFLRLASHYAESNQKDKILEVLEKMEEVLPEAVIPITNVQAKEHVARMYEYGGNSQEFEQRLTMMLDEYPDNPGSYSLLLAYYDKNERYQEASDLLQRWIIQHPDDKMAAQRMEEYRQQAAAAEQDSVVPLPELPEPQSKQDVQVVPEGPLKE